MKVIDLILKYNKKEEMPENILINGFNFKYDGALTYIHKDFDKDTYLFTDDYDWADWLNKEIEILEEDNKLTVDDLYIDDRFGYQLNLQPIIDKINKIQEEVDKLNEVLNEKD